MSRTMFARIVAWLARSAIIPALLACMHASAATAAASQASSPPLGAGRPYMICHPNAKGPWENAACPQGICHAECTPPRTPIVRPTPCSRDCVAAHANCDSVHLESILRACRNDCDPLTLYSRLAPLRCAFDPDAFWAPDDAQATALTLSDGKVRIGWNVATCRMGEAEQRMKAWAPSSRETAIIALLAFGCRFEVVTPFTGMRQETAQFTRASVTSREDRQPVAQPKGQLAFSCIEPDCTPPKVYSPMLFEQPKLDCNAPGYLFGSKFYLLCSGEQPIGGVYLIYGDKPPFTSVRARPSSIAYLGQIWSGPVIALTTEIVASPPQPPQLIYIAIFVIGAVGLGALAWEFLKRLLARSPARSTGDAGFAAEYVSRSQDIVVIPRPDGRFDVQRKDAPPGDGTPS